MIVIIGASASGKTEISRILEQKYGYKKLITSTTRPMRVGEINHVDYHFLPKETFLEGIYNNDFIEHTCYNENYYGIHKNDINKNALVVVEPNGANTLIEQLGDKAYVVYIETKRDIREARMVARKDHKLDIELRLRSDDIIFNKENIKHIDLVVKNNEHQLEKVAKYIADNYLIYQNEKRPN